MTLTMSYSTRNSRYGQSAPIATRMTDFSSPHAWSSPRRGLDRAGAPASVRHVCCPPCCDARLAEFAPLAAPRIAAPMIAPPRSLLLCLLMWVYDACSTRAPPPACASGRGVALMQFLVSVW